MRKVIAFRTVTKMVLPFVIVLFYSPVKQVASLLDLIANFWQVNKSEWRTVLIYQIFQGNSMKGKCSVL
jgi:hypothetical protein